MKAFEYAGPSSVADAVSALADSDDSAALSGGTDLLSRMKDYVTSPARIVYLKDIKDLCGIEDDSGGLSIGAGTRLCEILAHKGLGEKYPALRQATLEVGTPQIRNMATVGGNLLQRPRCWYYRNGFGILGMKDGKSLVRAGDNRYHAIFETDGDALFACPSSLAIPLVALGARATLQNKDGKSRTIAVADLYRVPKSEKDCELTLQPGELLTKVTIPAAKGKNASYEVRQKQAHDWPLVLCSVCVEMDGEKVGKACVVLGQVAPVPYRCEAAQDAIQGKPINQETATATAEAAVKAAKPLSMNGYKVALTKTAVKRALLAAAGDRYWEKG